METISVNQVPGLIQKGGFKFIRLNYTDGKNLCPWSVNKKLKERQKEIMDTLQGDFLPDGFYILEATRNHLNPTDHRYTYMIKKGNPKETAPPPAPVIITPMAEQKGGVTSYDSVLKLQKELAEATARLGYLEGENKRLDEENKELADQCDTLNEEVEGHIQAKQELGEGGIINQVFPVLKEMFSEYMEVRKRELSLKEGQAGQGGGGQDYMTYFDNLVRSGNEYAVMGELARLQVNNPQLYQFLINRYGNNGQANEATANGVQNDPGSN